MNQVISVSFPKDLLEEANKYIPSQKRSKAIVEAFSEYLEIMKKKSIEKNLRDACIDNAEFDLEITNEFSKIEEWPDY